jgi:hypothetical protein
MSNNGNETQIDVTPGVWAPSPEEIERMFEGEGTIQLVGPERDKAIVPTTWH